MQPQILVESHKLRAVSVSSNTLLGYSIDVKDGLVVLGGPGTDNSGLPGAAYLFASNGEQLHNLDPGTLLVGDRFGFAVATDGHKVVVGALGMTLIRSMTVQYMYLMLDSEHYSSFSVSRTCPKGQSSGHLWQYRTV